MKTTHTEAARRALRLGQGTAAYHMVNAYHAGELSTGAPRPECCTIGCLQPQRTGGNGFCQHHDAFAPDAELEAAAEAHATAYRELTRLVEGAYADGRLSDPAYEVWGGMERAYADAGEGEDPGMDAEMDALSAHLAHRLTQIAR